MSTHDWLRAFGGAYESRWRCRRCWLESNADLPPLSTHCHESPGARAIAGARHAIGMVHDGGAFDGGKAAGVQACIDALNQGVPEWKGNPYPAAVRLLERLRDEGKLK